MVSTTHLRVCGNNRCSEVLYQPEPFYISNGLGTILQEEGCIIAGQVAGARDGDVYTLTGWDENDNVVDDYRWTATYQLVYPNGEECGGTCLNPTLTQAQTP